MSSIYRINSGQLSIRQCLRAIDAVVARHTIFHTRFVFNVEFGHLQQIITDVTSYDGRSYPVVLSTVESEEDFKALQYQETLMSLDNSIFRCHLIRYDHNNADRLKEGDFVIFTFHHGSFDSTAVSIFLNEFKLAYSGVYGLPQSCLQYIDYATYERSNFNMTAAKDYWYEVLQGYSWDRQLDLPYDFVAPIDARRSGRCWSVVTDVHSDIVDAIITRAKELNTTLLQLTLTAFYIFLAQVSPRNQDVCVTIPIENRYRSELKNTIGLFVNMLPCRVSLDASSSSTVTFADLLHNVQNNLINMIKYGDMPYLELLAIHRVPTHKLQLPFLHTYFALIMSTDQNYVNQHQLNLTSPVSNEDSCSLLQYEKLTNPEDANSFSFPNMFDTDLTIYVDTAKKTMEFWWDYSIDLFTYSTINLLSKQFTCLLSDLFVSTPLQNLNTTPLVKFISLAKDPINPWIDNQQVCITRFKFFF